MAEKVPGYTVFNLGERHWAAWFPGDPNVYYYTGALPPNPEMIYAVLGSVAGLVGSFYLAEDSAEAAAEKLTGNGFTIHGRRELRYGETSSDLLQSHRYYVVAFGALRGHHNWDTLAFEMMGLLSAMTRGGDSELTDELLAAGQQWAQDKIEPDELPWRLELPFKEGMSVVRVLAM